MPGQDRTGPNGQGPLTGRGLGPCGRSLRCDFGRGYGRGFGFRARAMQAIPVQQVPQVITEKEEKAMLEEELKAIAQEKQDIEKRLKELKA